MEATNTPTLTRAEAEAILNQFICNADAAKNCDRTLVRQALHLVAEESDYQIFGICADTVTEGITALQSYLSALGYSLKPTANALEGPVYIKFNPKTGRCHLEPYLGEHRGVLVACQSSYADGICGTYGHLPLDLFTAHS